MKWPMLIACLPPLPAQAGVENQLRITDDGKFNYLVSRPDPSAHKGKDQILYRGMCVEAQ